MHELSIACELVEIADNAARDAGAARVSVVYLKLGVLSGVVPEALLFGYETATKGTLLEGSRLEIEAVPLVVHCPVCAQTSQLESIQYVHCPACQNPSVEVQQGREMELRSMEIVEHENETA